MTVDLFNDARYVTVIDNDNIVHNAKLWGFDAVTACESKYILNPRGAWQVTKGKSVHPTQERLTCLRCIAKMFAQRS